MTVVSEGDFRIIEFCGCMPMKFVIVNVGILDRVKQIEYCDVAIAKHGAIVYDYYSVRFIQKHSVLVSSWCSDHIHCV